MRLFLCIMLIAICSKISAQEVIPAKSAQILPGSKCYWGYHVERVGTAHDSLHYYMIAVSLMFSLSTDIS